MARILPRAPLPPSRSVRFHRAVPKSMTGVQFERVTELTARFAIIAMGAFAFGVVLSLSKPIMAPVALAIVVGLMFGPVADFLERRGIVPALSAGLVVLLFLGGLALAALLFAAPVAEWIQRGPVIWEKLRTQLVGLKQPFEAVGAIQDQLKTLVGSDAAMTVEVQDGGPVTDVAMLAPTLAADALLFLAGLYFFLATRTNLRLGMLSLCYSRRTRWRVAHVFRDVELKVSKFLLSAALINFGVGVATTIALWALGMPTPWLWGALAGIMNFVPYVGQAVMFVVLFVVGLGTQPGLFGAILPVIAYGAINLTADQVVFPHLVGRALTLNPFLIFLSIAFWIWVWGPIGGFVAVPSLLVLQSVVMHIFPTTAALPALVKRKLDMRAGADVAAATPTDPPPVPDAITAGATDPATIPPTRPAPVT